MEKVFNIGDKVIYNGAQLDIEGLVPGQLYVVDKVTAFGTVSMVGIEGFSFNPSQFSLAEFVEQVSVPEWPTSVTEILENAVSFDLNVQEELDGLMTEIENYVNEDQNRTVRFDNKPGSAIVHYTSGAKFHIGKLCSISVFEDGDQVFIDVSRSYNKDGIDFFQTATIPVEVFEKLTLNPPKEDDEFLTVQTEIIYDEKLKSLVYPLFYKTKELNLA